MSIGISLVLVVFFLAMNAFFVIAEFALVRVRKSQLELAVEEGKPGAKAAMEIALNAKAGVSPRAPPAWPERSPWRRTDFGARRAVVRGGHARASA